MSAPAIRNWEIVMLALQIEEAGSRRVHTEDVTLRCYELAPDAFSWLKHRKYPDKEVVRKDLTRLRDGQFGGVFVAGRAGITRLEGDGEAATTDGWQLTPAGVEWLVGNRARLDELLGRRQSKANRQDALKALDRVRQHDLFAQFRENPTTFAPALGELANMLRCRVDADDGVWAARFVTLRNHATLTEEAEIQAFLDRCESLRPMLV